MRRSSSRLGPIALAACLTASIVAQQADHWAYRAPRRPTPPTVQDRTWVRNPIDAFVLARLEARGTRPAPRAARARLLRRVYLDLTGLPPDVADLDAFLADRTPQAYQKVVDRLLASPRFGEHQARQWLDLARYADSNGFQADQLRDSWAYRDWVIGAFNADMPFDRFTIEQLAGDLLPAPTQAQKIATGFHRTVTCNVEAGVHPEANRVNQVVDRVNTTATVWLGTTLACAQCHDHKYDPFTQRDYFRLFAYFNNTPLEVKNPTGKGVRFDFYGPKLDLPLRPDQQARLTELRGELAAARTDLADSRADATARQPDWERRTAAALADEVAWQPLPTRSFASTGDEDHELLADNSVLIGGRVPGTATYTVTVDTQLRGITAVRLETLTHPSLPGTGPGRGDDERPNFILSEFRVRAQSLDAGATARPRAVRLHDARADHSQRGWPVAAAIDGDSRKGWAIGGGFFKDHWASFRTRSPVGTAAGTRLTFVLDQDFGRGRTIGRFRLSAFTGDPTVLAIPPGIAAILRRPAAQRRPKQRQQLRTYYLKNHARTAQLARRVRALEKQIAETEPPTTLVMVEDKTRQTHVMRRGNYLHKGEPVAAGTPAALHAYRADWPRNRLGLARWLVSEDNPLVARVTVNRQWSALFGRGLVATEEDFGLRAPAPTHPGLLDWLATEFVASGWSQKHLLRLLVTSATYQQSSRRRQDLEDPDNRLWGRGARFRMTAEMIRDNALAIGGLLDLNGGGPPVYPPQPPGLWRQTGRNEPKYVAATDGRRFRRGIYVVWRRAAPYPSFVLFDGPDRSTCHPVRSRTNTPMQALTLMNDAAYVEAALGFARRIITERPEGSVVERIEHAFRVALARRPTAAETQHLVAVQARELARLNAAPERAAALIDGVVGLTIAEALDRTELAAWFFVATVILNLDETISKG